MLYIYIYIYAEICMSICIQMCMRMHISVCEVYVYICKFVFIYCCDNGMEMLCGYCTCSLSNCRIICTKMPTLYTQNICIIGMHIFAMNTYMIVYKCTCFYICVHVCIYEIFACIDFNFSPYIC